MGSAGPPLLSPLLEALPDLLVGVVDRVPRQLWDRRPAAGGFALVEQAWHLADLEAEGYGLRLRRLVEEERPALPDFDGEAVARERRYLELDAREGASRFRRSRVANLEKLRSISPGAWERAGTQEGVGPLTLRDLPRMMLGHDRSHAGELDSLLSEVAPGDDALGALRALVASLSL